MSQLSHDTATLDDLIATILDSFEGYAVAARHCDSKRFIALFNARATERQALILTLRREVARLGGTPADEDTPAGSAYRRFVGLASVVISRDDTAIIDAVGRGENHLKHRLECAIDDPGVSSPVKHAIRACYSSIKQSGARMPEPKQRSI